MLGRAGDMLAGRRCLIALSGGPDSAVAAWLAIRFASETRAIHVHHGWPDSDVMARAAEAVALHLGVPLRVVRVHPGNGASREAQARHARYEALFGAAEPDELIIVGHTRDDQAETVLFNVARGGGARGVSGIPARRGPIVRPLLSVSRAVVEELVAADRIPTVDDRANHDSGLTRNRVRAALPLLADAIGTDIVAGLIRSGSIAEQDEEALLAIIERVRPIQRGDTHRLPLAVLRSLQPGMARLAILKLLRQVRPYGATAAELERVESIVRDGRGIVQLAGGLIASMSKTSLVVGPEPGRPPPPYAWGPELGMLRWGGWLLEAIVCDGRPAAVPLSNWIVAFDTAIMEDGRLMVRAATPEDRICLRSGHKGARQAIAEGGLAKPDRVNYPIVTAGDTVLWVPGIRRAALGWVSDATSRYLLVRIVEEG